MLEPIDFDFSDPSPLSSKAPFLIWLVLSTVFSDAIVRKSLEPILFRVLWRLLHMGGLYGDLWGYVRGD